jgi:hypothetical protein
MRFDLSAPSSKLLREISIQDDTVMQSFTFTSDAIYTIQVVSGGQKLPGEPQSSTGTDRLNRGDLTITKLSLTGVEQGHMYLLGAGHGVAIGSEKIGSDTFLWTELDADSAARGTNIGRFKFVDGCVLTGCSPYVTRYVYPGDNVTPVIDGSNICIRYDDVAGHRYATYDLTSFKAGGLVPISDVLVTDPVYTFQGWTLYSGYLYLLEGDAYGSPDSTAPDGNTYITIVDAATGEVVDRQLTRAANTLDYREPEGMAIQSTTGGPRLCFGFASGASGARLASIYYKNVLI